MVGYSLIVLYVKMVHHTYLILYCNCNLQCVSNKLSDVSCGGVGFICAERYVNKVWDIVMSYSGFFTKN